MTESEGRIDDRLADLVALPDDHPEVQALRRDPEQWVRFIALREFLHSGAPPEGARTDEAVQRMMAALDEALGSTARELDASPDAARSASAGAGSRFGPRVTPAGWGIALAAAAAVVVIGVFVLPGWLDREGTTRGPEPIELQVAPPRFEGDRVRFSWNGVEGADHYEVQFLTAHMLPARPPVTVADTALVLENTQLFRAEDENRAAYWRLTALRGGLVLARSPHLQIEMPR